MKVKSKDVQAVKNSLQGIPVLSYQETVNSVGLPKEDWEELRNQEHLGELGKITEGWWSNNWLHPDAEVASDDKQ